MYNNQSIFIYFSEGDYAKVLAELHNGVNVNIRHHAILDTLLHRAVYKGDVEITRALLGQGADIYVLDKNHCTAFYISITEIINEKNEATREHLFKIAELLLQHENSIRQQNPEKYRCQPYLKEIGRDNYFKTPLDRIELERIIDPNNADKIKTRLASILKEVEAEYKNKQPLTQDKTVSVFSIEQPAASKTSTLDTVNELRQRKKPRSTLPHFLLATEEAAMIAPAAKFSLWPKGTGVRLTHFFTSWITSPFSSKPQGKEEKELLLPKSDIVKRI